MPVIDCHCSSISSTTLSFSPDTDATNFKGHITLTRSRTADAAGSGVEMTIREWLEDLRFAGMKLGLERAQALLERLGNPQLEFPSIHVAGTNGKGSLCAQLSANATASGLSVGLFTTPHLVMVEERIRIDGRPISSADFDRHVEAVHEAASEGEVLEPTFYEVTFIAAMLHFAEIGIERAIIETGLGGRGDATRLVDADLCVITTISKDHAEILGDTLPEIAREKVGIHRPGVPLIALESNDGAVTAVFAEVAGDDLYLHEKIPGHSPWEIWAELAGMISLAMGWSETNAPCTWPGRSPNWKPSGFASRVTFSAAHNDEGFQAELDRIQEPCVFVIGMSAKHDLEQTTASVTSELWHLNTFRHIVVTQPTSGRLPAVEAEDLARIICGNRLDPPLIENDPIRALNLGVTMANQGGINVVVMGSIYLIGDILSYHAQHDGLDLWEELSIH